MGVRRPLHVDGGNVVGAGRLSIEATSGIIDIVESIHNAVLENILPGTRA